MDDEDADALRQRDRLELKRATVDQERASGPAGDRDEWVHDPDRDGRRDALRFAAGACQLDARKLEVRRSAQRGRERDRERGAGREPAADRDRARYRGIEADRRSTATAQGF